MTLPLTPRNANILQSLPVLGHESVAHKTGGPLFPFQMLPNQVKKKKPFGMLSFS